MVHVTTEPQPRHQTHYRPHSRLADPLHRWVNGDGERHPLENTLAFLTLALGAVSVVCLLPGAWQVSFWTAFAGAMMAAWDEFISKTSGERWLILVGFALCVIGIAVSSANGGVF